MGEEISEIKEKLEKLDKMELSIQQLSERVDKLFQHMEQRNVISVAPDLGITGEERNPWGERLAKSVMVGTDIQTKLANILDRLAKDRQGKYESTLEALRMADSDSGLTAEEVAAKTNHRRHTESAKLKELYIAGYLDRDRQGRQVRYKLRS